MRKPWIDRVLTQLEGGDLKGLLEAVVATSLGFQQEIESFRTHWLDLPESVEPEASPLERSLVDLHQLLTELQTSVNQNNRREWAERLRPPLARLRHLRKQLETTPTANMTVNRLLRRLRRWLEGAPVAPSTRQLLEQLPALEDQWDAVIAQVEPDQQEELWAHLDPALQSLCAWRDRLDLGPDEQSSQWPGQIETGVRDFEAALAAQVEREVAAGPTPFAIINLLVRTLDEQGPSPELSELARAAHQLLALQVAADTLALSQLDETLKQLDSPNLRDELIKRSLQLARLHRAEAGDHNLVDVHSGASGLPPMLEGLHGLAVEVVQGRLERQALQPGVTQLEGLITRFRTARQPNLQTALQDLQEVAAVLRDLQISPGRGLLLELRESLENCARSLASL